LSDSSDFTGFTGCTELPTGVRVDIEVKVRSSQSRVLGIKANRLSVALAAPPVDGAANAALIETLAAHFGVPRRQVRLVAGERSRRKVVELSGLSKSALLARIPGP
jgi:uncharacterized protein (TIGR00251 family)